MAAATISEHLGAAVRLARRDASAIQEFANTPVVAWFSFAAALVALPLFFVTVALGGREVGGLLDIIAELGPYALGWLAFPVVMAEVARVMDRDRLYCRYITAVNWCNVVEYAAMTVITLVAASGILPAGLERLMFFAIVVWVLIYQHFVARVALQIDALPAALLVGLRMLIDLAIVALAGILGS